jgi:hypothetical protein
MIPEQIYFNTDIFSSNNQFLASANAKYDYFYQNSFSNLAQTLIAKN